MDIRELKYIETIARTKRMKKAADELYISQPALFNALKKVEEELDTTLFYRIGYDMYPTDTGQVVVDTGRQILALNDKITEQIIAVQNLRRGKVKLGYPTVIAENYMGESINAFREKYPEISVELQEAGATAVAQMVANGELDVALGLSPTGVKDVFEVPLIRDEIVVSVRADHPWAKRPFLTLSDFKDVPFATFDESHGVRTFLKSLFAKIDVDPIVEVDSASPKFLCTYGHAGNTPVILPRPFMNQAIDQNDILIPFMPSLPWIFCMIYRKEGHMSMATEAMTRFFQSYFLNHYQD